MPFSSKKNQWDLVILQIHDRILPKPPTFDFTESQERQSTEENKSCTNSKPMTCMVCAITLDTFEMFCEHMVSAHNEHKEDVRVNKHNCIMCDTDFNSIEALKIHYMEKHIYCQQCNDFLTDEDAFQKHNLQEHNIMPNVSVFDNS